MVEIKLTVCYTQETYGLIFLWKQLLALFKFKYRGLYGLYFTANRKLSKILHTDMFVR